MKRESVRLRWSPFRGADPTLWIVAATANLLMFATAYVAHLREASEVGLGEAPVYVQIGATPRGVPTVNANDAFSALASESVFEGAHVGFVGMPSRQAQAMQVLLAERESRALFKALAESARYPAGRLYGLLGLRITNAAAYRNAHVAFAHDQTQLQTTFGCIAGTLTVADVVRMIDSGELVREFIEHPQSTRIARMNADHNS